MQSFTDNKQKNPRCKAWRIYQYIQPMGFTYIRQVSNTQLRCNCTVKTKLVLAPPTGGRVNTFRTGVYSYPINQKQAYYYIIVVEH